MKTLYNKKEIRRQTEKAVLIYSDIYDQIHDLDRYDSEYLHGRDQMNRKDDVGQIWLPLSQIVIEDGYVVQIQDWLIRKYNLKSQEYVDFVTEKREEGLSKYMELVEKAKKLGVKGVRKGLKTRTILEKARQQGIELQ